MPTCHARLQCRGKTAAEREPREGKELVDSPGAEQVRAENELDIADKLPLAIETTIGYTRSNCVSIRPSVRPSVRLSIRPSVRVFVCPPVRLSVRLSVRSSVVRMPKHTAIRHFISVRSDMKVELNR